MTEKKLVVGVLNILIISRIQIQEHNTDRAFEVPTFENGLSVQHASFLSLHMSTGSG